MGLRGLLGVLLLRLEDRGKRRGFLFIKWKNVFD